MDQREEEPGPSGEEGTKKLVLSVGIAKKMRTWVQNNRKAITRRADSINALAAYIPEWVLQSCLTKEKKRIRASSIHFTGAAMIVDISGFSKLSEKLSNFDNADAGADGASSRRSPLCRASSSTYGDSSRRSRSATESSSGDSIQEPLSARSVKSDGDSFLSLAKQAASRAASRTSSTAAGEKKNRGIEMLHGILNSYFGHLINKVSGTGELLVC